MIELAEKDMGIFLYKWKAGLPLEKGVFYFFNHKNKKYMCIDNRKGSCYWMESGSLQDCETWVNRKAYKESTFKSHKKP